MKILLDVCTPVQIRQALAGHDVFTATKMGWGEIENGELLQRAEAADFALLIICDKNLQHQQNLSTRKISILQLWTNHRPTLERHFALIGQTVATIKSGEYRALDDPGITAA